MQSYSTMENLTMLLLADCPSCLSLPQVLGDLPHLETLSLINLGVDYIIEEEVQRSNSRKPKFPCVEDLILQDLPHLKGLVKEEARVVFPNLGELTVHGCPSFTLPQLSSLKVVACNKKVLPSFGKLDNLTTLWIEYDENKALDPIEALENLINLQSLTILGANEHSMPDEGLQGLKSLTKLHIRGYNTITCLPARWLSHLTFLKDLSLYACSELVEIPEAIKCLHGLTSLTLMELPKMVCLPDALQHLTSLQFMWLHFLTELTSLPDWLGNLTSLSTLRIYSCQKVVSFPASIREIGTLRRLYVVHCPVLWRRCQKREGEDWHKVAHIPCIRDRLENY